MTQPSGELRGAVLGGKIVQHGGGGGEACRVAAQQRLVQQVFPDHAFAEPVWTDHDDVGGGFQELEGEELIEERAIELFNDEEIVACCMLALVNEGARVLEEGIAHSAPDIDSVCCNGYGFSRTRGGPMFHAETMGLSRVLAIMEKHRAQEGARYWRPAPLLESLESPGRRIADWRS